MLESALFVSIILNAWRNELFCVVGVVLCLVCKMGAEYTRPYLLSSFAEKRLPVWLDLHEE